MSTPGNGDYRLRGIERGLDALERRLDELDRHGSRKAGELDIELRAIRDDVKALDNTLTWLVRAIAGVIFVIMGAVAIAILSGLTGG